MKNMLLVNIILLISIDLFGQIDSNDIDSINLSPCYIIPNSDPPTELFKIKEGNCGEACLFTVFKMQGKYKSQEYINIAGGNPKRGLHGSEIKRVIRDKRIIHKDISVINLKYSKYLRETIIPMILNGNPILLGVKIYPDTHPEWSSDHFILLVGYDANTDEIIFNSGERRHSISVNKLLNRKDGYSLLNQYNEIYAIQFAGCTNCTLFTQFK